MTAPSSAAGIRRCWSPTAPNLPDLLADDVRIKLDDLGIVQSKQEFIASLDEWKGAVAGAAIRHRIEKSEGGVTTVIACYDFPDNDMLMQETFAVADNRITASSQAAIAENCEAYLTGGSWPSVPYLRRCAGRALHR